MDLVTKNVGTYMLKQSAGKEISSIGNEINDSIEGGAKWLKNKVKVPDQNYKNCTGKKQKPLPELLKEYYLPIGLFPEDATKYEFKGNTHLTVHVPVICEVTFKETSMARFNSTVTGLLEKGRLYEIEGIKTKISFLWPKVSEIMTEGTRLHLMTTIKRTSSERVAYEILRAFISTDKF